MLDRPAFDHNVQHVAELLARGRPGLTLRLASKSLRVPALIQRVLDFGPPYRGVMCFAAAEAAGLFAAGIDDLLLAYPVSRRSDLETIRGLHDAGCDLKVMVDDAAQVTLLAAALAGTDRPLPVVVDLDASLRVFGLHLGVRRSPVRQPEDAVALFEACADTGGALRPVGVMAYEAQVAGLADNSPHTKSKNVPIRAVRTMSVRAIHSRRQAVRAALEAAGFGVELFNGGGSGSLDTTPFDPAVTEVTAGSAFFCPHLFDHYQHVHFEPAAFIALAVTRASDPGFVTCAGGGYIASGAAGPDRLPEVAWPPGLSLVAAEGAGEVQTPVTGKGVMPGLGDLVLLRHAKAGEVAERFAHMVIVEGGAVVERAPTYRGLGVHLY